MISKAFLILYAMAQPVPQQTQGGLNPYPSDPYAACSELPQGPINCPSGEFNGACQHNAETSYRFACQETVYAAFSGWNAANAEHVAALAEAGAIYQGCIDNGIPPSYCQTTFDEMVANASQWWADDQAALDDAYNAGLANASGGYFEDMAGCCQ